ncbi:MAG TPA: transglycosylase domain-containing protein [Gammaproteobacteria bacterium]|nr:transglycosylase domain-containing protein [Gammaproteobacteria bacterium]
MFLSRYASEIEYWMEEGANPSLRFAEPGPYDRRLGYSELPSVLSRLDERGFRITAQARTSPRFGEALDLGVFPIYDEKPQAGLRIRSGDGDVLHSERYPARIFPTLDTVPPLLIRSLLYVENRELLQTNHPFANPAIEWDRLGLAVVQAGLRSFGSDNDVPGGSTLATQIEKFRHSPNGVTATPTEKLRQMMSASVRTYRGGRDTLQAREQIAVDYVNGVPLGAIPGHGEIHGLLDGLALWYGINEDELSLLWEPIDTAQLAAAARVYRAALSLLLASRRPTFYLGQEEGNTSLSRLSDSYLRLLASEEVISEPLMSASLTAHTNLHRSVHLAEPHSFITHKAASAIRTDLLNLLGVRSLYELDRFDLTAMTSILQTIQDLVTNELRDLADATYRANASLAWEGLLPVQDSVPMIFSFLLGESTPDGNLVRVQTDSFDGPRDANRNTRLELGSTAKLRTLVSYLEAVEQLYAGLAHTTSEARTAYLSRHDDPLTEWVNGLLAHDSETSLQAVLTAAMKRSYSASPAERFFTGGGLHAFSNFDHRFDSSRLTVEEAFVDSVNLVFIRLMRDVVHYHIARLPSAAVLDERNHPLRSQYLVRFADDEGQVFMRRFYQKHVGRSPMESIDLMLEKRAQSAIRLGRVYRFVLPAATIDELSTFLAGRLTEEQLDLTKLEQIYRESSPAEMHLADLGYLTGIHPLELWVVQHIAANPEASLTTTLLKGVDARQEAYRWLFRTTRTQRQDQRIRIILEMDAFAAIHKDWQRLGYPFSSLVPSYATAIGSSGDSPQALAELVGILVNDGLRRPLMTIEELRFAEGTPFETHVRRVPPNDAQVLSKDIAEIARSALAEVIQNGTGRRLRNVFEAADGTPMFIGGKTGTGDNRFEAAGTGRRAQHARNRTATLLFFVENYFGVVTAYVEGPESDDFAFTSALPAQILRHLAPALTPLLQDAETIPTDPVLWRRENEPIMISYHQANERPLR